MRTNEDKMASTFVWKAEARFSHSSMLLWILGVLGAVSVTKVLKSSLEDDFAELICSEKDLFLESESRLL